MMNKIKTGRDGLRKAIREAFEGDGCSILDPAIKYSPSKGFQVESNLTLDDDDVVWRHRCAFSANTGDPNIRIGDYSEIRAEILETIKHQGEQL